MSADLCWLIVRNNNAHLLKRNKQVFTTEPNNLKNRNSQRYSGLVNRKTVGVEALKEGGVALITRKTNGKRRPCKAFNRVELKRNNRSNLNVIRKTLRASRYRKDLKMAAVRRASALMRSQKTVVVKKRGGAAKKE